MFCACERCAVDVMRREFEFGAYWGYRAAASATGHMYMDANTY